MNGLLYKYTNKTYGGYVYVEVDLDNKVFATGDSRAHRGHGSGNYIVTYVSKKSDLKDIQEQLEMNDIVETPNIYDFQRGEYIR